MNQNLKDKEFQRICRDEANAGETVIVGTQKPATETVLAKIRELWNYLERRGMSHVEIRSGVFAADGREICDRLIVTSQASSGTPLERNEVNKSAS